MITLHQVMLYSRKQEEVAQFWRDHLGFRQERLELGPAFALVMSDDRAQPTQLVIHNCDFVQAANPEMNRDTPSLLLAIDGDIAAKRDQMVAAGVTVGDLVAFPDGNRVFNFADPEGNYYAMTEKQGAGPLLMDGATGADPPSLPREAGG